MEPKIIVLLVSISFCFSTNSKGAHSFTSNRVLDVHEFEHAGEFFACHNILPQ